MAAARETGLNASILRFSNVYGDAKDHPDRVIPAFAGAAARGGEIRVEGSHLAFDFTHVEDVATGIEAMVQLLAAGDRAPLPIHFVSGVSTTLGQLASMAQRRGP